MAHLMSLCVTAKTQCNQRNKSKRKTLFKRLKKQATDWEKIVANCMSDKGLYVSCIYETYLCMMCIYIFIHFTQQ